MSAIFAWPAELKWRDPGVALTLVVPANACNLSCAFCAIRQRSEITETRLAPEDYAAFIRQVALAEPTAMVSIQGYEPLLPEAWDYTRCILKTARALGVPGSLVTNGVLLKTRAAELASLDPAGVTVSLDSSAAKEHDRLRGKVGAFDATVEGVRALAGIDNFADRLTISSVLLPRRRRYLEGMPELLAELGVRQWAVSPLLKVGGGGVGGPVAPSEEIIDDVLRLHERAARAGVTLVLDDELDCLRERRETYREFLVRRFDRPDGLVRLTPSGACSVGRQILAEVDDDTPVWRPQDDAVAFLRGAQDASRRQELEAA